MIKRFTPRNLYLFLNLLAAFILSGCLGTERPFSNTPVPTLYIPTRISSSESAPTPAVTLTPPKETETEAAAAETSDTSVDEVSTLTEATETDIPATETPSATPVLNAAAAWLELGNLPPTNYDLAYVSASSLWLWTHQNRQVASLFNPEVELDRYPEGATAEIQAVDFSADGNRAAVLVRYDLPTETSDLAEGVNAEESETLDVTTSPTLIDENNGQQETDNNQRQRQRQSEYDIFFIDTVSKEVWPLATAIDSEVNAISLAPDQTEILFATYFDTADELRDEPERFGTLTKIGTPSGNAVAPVVIAECEPQCTDIIWRKDSQLYLFSDANAIYFADRQATSAQVAYSNQIEIERLKPIAWAPNDRAFHLIYWPVDDGPPKEAIFDFPTGKLIDLSNMALINASFWSESGWMSDSRLVTTYALTARSGVLLQTRRVDFESGEIVLDEERELSAVSMAGSFTQLTDGRFVFVRPDLDDLGTAGLYRLTSFSEEPERINPLPLSGDTPDAIWAPDGTSAVIMHRFSYVAGSDGNLYQFEQAISAPHWLPNTDVGR